MVNSPGVSKPPGKSSRENVAVEAAPVPSEEVEIGLLQRKVSHLVQSEQRQASEML